MTETSWLSSQETHAAFVAVGLRDADLIRELSSACQSDRLVSTGFRQLTIGDGHALNFGRDSLKGGKLWFFFDRAFRDGNNPMGHQSTILESDWTHTDFKYRIERNEGDIRAPIDVKCWLNWSQGSASYCFTSETGKHVQEVCRSLQFDRLGVEALARQWKKSGARELLSIDETVKWLGTTMPRNIKKAWPKYRDEFGSRAIAKAAFEQSAKQTWNQSRGRPKSNSN